MVLDSFKFIYFTAFSNACKSFLGSHYLECYLDIGKSVGCVEEGEFWKGNHGKLLSQLSIK